MGPGNLQSATGSNLWHTPIPYLFGGLGAMMVLIAIALIVLACSHRDPSSQRDPESVEKPAIHPLDMEPRILVIMAGNDEPTYLAKPINFLDSTSPTATIIPPVFMWTQARLVSMDVFFSSVLRGNRGMVVLPVHFFFFFFFIFSSPAEHVNVEGKCCNLDLFLFLVSECPD